MRWCGTSCARSLPAARSPFGFLFTTSRKEEVVAEYVIREHHGGRGLNDILKDAYVTNRAGQVDARRLLDRPEVIAAVGDDVLHDLRGKLGLT